jgi:hypothetical protein
MKRDARNVRPSLSDDPRDKLLAALNWSYGKLKDSATYDRAPMSCRKWHDKLTPEGAAEGEKVH